MSVDPATHEVPPQGWVEPSGAAAAAVGQAPQASSTTRQLDAAPPRMALRNPMNPAWRQGTQAAHERRRRLGAPPPYFELGTTQIGRNSPLEGFWSACGG